MSAWSDLGLPTPNSGDYAYTISPGIYRTPFPTYKPDQAVQYRKSRKTFSLSIDLDRTQLKTAEDYLRSVGYRQFGMELVTAEGRLVETAIRLTEPYRVTPKGFRTFVLSLTAETSVAFWTGQTYVVENAELSTVYTSPEWSLSDQIPASSTLEVRSGQVRYQPPGLSSWTQWVSTNLIIEGGGKIQVRQTSSQVFDCDTVGEVRISGVPWVIRIRTYVTYTDETFSLALYAIDVASEPPIPEASHALWDQENKAGQFVHAKALMYGRYGKESKRAEVQLACQQVMGTEINPSTGLRSSSLAIGRGLLTYVLSAEVVGLDEPLLSSFKDWLLTTITTNNSENRSLKRSFETQSSQWGLYSGASYIAACRYLGDTSALAAAANVFKGWLGDRSAYSGFASALMAKADAWRPDPSAPVGINPPSSFVTWEISAGGDGKAYDVSGCIPDGVRQWDSGPEGQTSAEGEFVYPFPTKDDPWAMLQGAFAIAWQLEESGYPDVWTWSENALLRAVVWLVDQAKNIPTGDDEWLYHVCNSAYGTSYPVPTVTASGKQLGYADYLFGAQPLIFPVPDIESMQGRLWVDSASLAKKSTSSPAWTAMKAYADVDPVSPEVWNNNDMADASVLACAYVWARTGNEAYRTKAKEICLSAIGTEIIPSTGLRASSLQLGRNLLSYVVAADLIGFREVADEEEVSAFEEWVRDICFGQNSDGRSVASCHYIRSNNWGTMCGSSILAAYAWLGERDKFCAAAAIYKAYLGDRDIYSGWAWRYDFTWHADMNEMRPINAKGTTIPWDNPYVSGPTNGVVDGVLPEEMRRWDGVSYIWPAPAEQYCWDALQGALAQAVITNRAGYDSFEWEDQALLRAYTWIHTYPVFFNNYVFASSESVVSLSTTGDAADARGVSVIVSAKDALGQTINEEILLDASDSSTTVYGEEVVKEILSVTVAESIGVDLKLYAGDMECARLSEIEGGVEITQSYGYPATGDDIWQPILANLFYGADFPVSSARPGSFGKNIGFTDWSHR